MPPNLPRIQPGLPVAVLGAGNMGSGIAQACAQAGFSVRVRDVSDAMVARGRGLIEKTLEGAIQRKKLSPQGRDEILGRITTTTGLQSAVSGASLVVEAIFEDESQKKALFAEIASQVGPETVVASNTSSLSVARLADGFPSPERFAGLHFFFPAAINKLIEIIGGEKTAPETLRWLEAFSYRLKKVPIQVRDSAGFAVNRFFVPYLNEAARMAGDGVASLATIEEAGRETLGTTLGPFELMNVTGIPIAFHSESSLFRAFGPAYAPAPALEERFRAGTPWDWKSTSVEPAKKEAVRRRFLGLVFGITTRLVEEGVATAEATNRGALVGLRWKKGPFDLLSQVGIREAHAEVEEFARPWGPDFPIARELRDRAERGETEWPQQYVRVERDGPVAWVLLDRPEVLNSLNSRVLRQVDDAFRDLESQRDVRVVVLAGSSPVFAAGADIAEMAAKDLPAGRAFGFFGQAICRRIEEFRAPVLALVEGYALGGGLELALAADFIVAADGARLGLPETSVGIHPGFGGASRLTHLIGKARTKLLVFSGVPVTAREAYELGFVAHVFPAESARVDARALARTIAERAPLAVEWVKTVINRAADSSLDASLRLEGESAGHTFATRDRTEGMQAFLERRRPEFEGR
jgi:enoyl-CoA hydratase/3-hydroxyacyl-CoA dehydrogenase